MYPLILRHIDFLYFVENNYAQFKPNEVVHFYLKNDICPYTCMKDCLYYQQILHEIGSMVVKPIEWETGFGYDFRD